MGGARRVVGVWVLAAAVVTVASPAGAASPAHANDDAFSVLQDTTVSLPVLQNDVLGQGGSNPSNAPARVTATNGSTAQGGSYVCLSGGGTCSYTAPAGFVGTDSFEYRIGFRFGSPPGTWVPTDIGLVTVTIVANEPPTAVDDVDTVRGTGQLVTYVIPNDTDPNEAVRGERLSVVPGSTTSVEGGTVECGTGTDLYDCVYTAPPGFLGVDSYEYTVVDRFGLSDVGMVTVTVTPNLPPTANDDSGIVVYAWYFNGVAPQLTMDLLANDTDPDDTYLQFDSTPVVTAAGGDFRQAVFSNLGSYTPPVGFYGFDTFTYVASDAHGGLSSATASIEVRPDLAPVAATDTRTVRGSKLIDIDPLANDSDDFDTIFLVGANFTTANGGSVNCTSGAPGFGAGCTYSAAPGFAGNDSFTYTIWDTHQSSTGLVEIDVTPNAAPVITSSSVTAHIREPNKPYGRMLGLSVSDADNDAISFPFVNTSAAGATVYCSQASYTPLGVPRPPTCSYFPLDAAFRGQDTVTLIASDDRGGSSAPVTITVNIVDDMPIIAPDIAATTAPDTPVRIDVVPIDEEFSVDGGGLFIVSPPTVGGTLSCSSGEVELVRFLYCMYTPPAGFIGTDVFEYSVSDRWSTDVGAITVAVAPADGIDPTISVVTPADGASYSLGQSVTSDYSCADAGGSGLASCTGTTASGTAIDTSTAGSHSFAVTAVDGAGNDTVVTSTYHVRAGDVSQNVVGPQSVDTDPGGLGASPTVPLQTQIDVPAGVSGQITVTPAPAGPPPSGFVLFSRQATISGPAAPGPTSPHLVTFTIDASELGGTPPASVAVFRNGVAVAACAGPTDAAPDPCVASRTALGDGDAELVVRTTQFSTWTLGRRTFLVSSVDPASRAQGVTAQTIHISGYGFQPTATVKFSGTGVTIASTTVSSPSSITLSVAVSGTAAVGARNLTVTNPGAVTATCTGCFTINAKPTVSTASPSSRPQGASHQAVVITGTNFQPGATATISGSGVTVHSTTFVDPAHVSLDVSVDLAAAIGNRNVVIANPDGGTATGVSDFAVNVLPTVTSVSPTNARRGQTSNISILGSGFAATFVTGGGVVSFGPDITVNSVTRNSATKLTANVTIGSGATTGARSVSITNPDGGTAGCAGCLTVIADPQVVNVSPSSFAQGVIRQVITVTGSGFGPGATAKFTPAGVTVNSVTVTSSSSLSIEVTVGGAAAVGARDLTITNTNTSATTCAGCFSVAAKPTVASLTPNSSPRGATGQTVVVNGAGFQPGVGVTFSGTGVTATVVSTTPTAITLSVTVAANAAATNRSVTVTNLDGGTVTRASSFRVT